MLQQKAHGWFCCLNMRRWKLWKQTPLSNICSLQNNIHVHAVETVYCCIARGCILHSEVHQKISKKLNENKFCIYTRQSVAKACKIIKTRMWANAQRDGRPAEYRWHPLFNAAKFGWHPPLECRAVTLPRRETHWNLQGCPKLANRSPLLVGRSSPYCKDMWRRYRCLTSFFPIADICLSCEDTAR